ncbi:MAG: formate/nitrite transporter family protein [Nitrospirae bacterium]|nr:formate/nitrite transporter family protein [Nitrospirota bacterium]MDA1305232.1 formate/nitrite transporter family protein [Nitrospirota bacterium]
MYIEDLKRMAEVSRKKVEYFLNAPGGYFLLSALAGIYLGLGICLIFSVGAPFAAEGSAALKLVMGVSFGVALTLVIFAGSELFTGNNMVCTIGALARAITWKHVGWIFLWSFIGNLVGSLLVAWMIVQSGVMSKAPQMDLLMKVAAMKMSASAWELFIRGILCNVLVCLAVWMAARTKNEAAKIMLIFWCLFAFIGSGFEHSIANQSLLGMALFLPHGEAISWMGFAWNQVFVGLGNIVGGAVLVGGAYWLSSPYRVADSIAVQSETETMDADTQEPIEDLPKVLPAGSPIVQMRAGFVAVLKHERGAR